MSDLGEPPLTPATTPRMQTEALKQSSFRSTKVFGVLVLVSLVLPLVMLPDLLGMSLSRFKWVHNALVFPVEAVAWTGLLSSAIWISWGELSSRQTLAYGACLAIAVPVGKGAPTYLELWAKGFRTGQAIDWFALVAGYDLILLLALFIWLHLFHICFGWRLIEKRSRTRHVRRRVGTGTLFAVITAIAVTVVVGRLASQRFLDRLFRFGGSFLGHPADADLFPVSYLAFEAPGATALQSVLIWGYALVFAAIIHFAALAYCNCRNWRSWIAAIVVPAVIHFVVQVLQYAHVGVALGEIFQEGVSPFQGKPFGGTEVLGKLLLTVVLCAGLFKTFSWAGYRLNRLPATGIG